MSRLRAARAPGLRSVPWPGRLGLAGLAVLVLVALVAPYLVGDAAVELSDQRRQPASPAHPLGTDALGRDLLARTLVATRVTVLMAAGSTVTAVLIGCLLGVSGALSAVRWRSASERVIDVLLSFPPLLIAIAIVTVLSPTELTASVAVGCALAPAFARLSRTLASSVVQREFVQLARGFGQRATAVLLRHVLPNISGPLLVLMSVAFVQSIVGLSAMSFLGLGVQAPSYDWGSMLSAGFTEMYTNPVAAAGPAIGIVFAGMMAGLAGDSLAGASNPLERRAQVAADRTPPGLGPRDVPAAPPAAGLRVRRLGVTRADGVALVQDVSLEVEPGSIIGLMGESGSGKSLTALAIAGLLPPGCQANADEAALGPVALLGDGDGDGDGDGTPRIGMVFQDPASSLNPALRIGTQLTEASVVHGSATRQAATAKALDLLREVRIREPERRMRQYPHELSGGMRQRVMLAMALMEDPALLIADEPTTALDVTVQADVLRLVRDASRRHGTATVFISHDVGVVADVCDVVLVMYAGRIIERLPVEAIRAGEVAHPYTRALLQSTPTLDGGRAELRSIPGRPPLPGQESPGCPFAPRCPAALRRCSDETPELRASGAGHQVACHLVDETVVSRG